MSYPDQPLFINGARHPTGQTFTSTNPATNTVLATIHRADTTTVNAAVSSSLVAFPLWSSTPAPDRARILLRAASLLRARNDAFARTETHDTGKPYSETSTVDVATGADVLEYYAHLVASGGLNGETTSLRSDAWVYTTKAPLGVCACIGAWNYPLQIALWKSAPALAAGNCVVYKPSEFTPLHALALAELYSEAGLPAGVFNVVQGDGAIGALLTAHPHIAKVSFTGQVATGRTVASRAAQDLKYVTMELGGKSPCIILPDADLDTAVDGAMMANFYSSGQVCTNGTRVFVPRSRQAEFEARLVAKMPFVRAGDVMHADTNFGPLVSAVHRDKVAGYIAHGIDVDRARVLFGGRGLPDPLPAGADARGFWVRPTVFTDCTDAMRIAREEIFGPVMCILPYDDAGEKSRWVDELVRRANDTPLGLAAGVFARDVQLAQQIVARLEAGITWINTWGESPAEMAVGGWKKSGLGVENGRKGLEGWTQNKSTLVEMAGSVATVFIKSRL